MIQKRLPKTFYAQDTRVVAKDLLGTLLVRNIDGKRLSGIVVETEAYIGFDDTASHAHKGPTDRCKVMFGDPGFAYVYLTYGIHNMFNIVTEKSSFPSAVLIRAIQPLEGITEMLHNRGVTSVDAIGDGPGKLAKAFGIDRTFNGTDLVEGDDIWLEKLDSTRMGSLGNISVVKTPRIGIDYADPVSRDQKWRFFVKGNPCVSRKTKS